MYKLKADDEIQLALNDVKFLVSATDFERHMLWQKWHHNEHRVSWEQIMSGFGPCIGTIDGRPICLSLSFAIIEGHKVLFHDVVSQLADYKMAEEWLEMHCKPATNGGRSTTDAQNFHICVHALQALNEQLQEAARTTKEEGAAETLELTASVASEASDVAEQAT
jgi:hypothetical protein